MEQQNYNFYDRESLEMIIAQKDTEIAYLKRMECLRVNTKAFQWFIASTFLSVFSIMILVGNSSVVIFNVAKLVVFAAWMYSMYRVVMCCIDVIYGKGSVKGYELEKELIVEDMTVEDLNKELVKAIAEEDYEYSAIIRDELSKRK